jgi:hypothetical protein
MFLNCLTCFGRHTAHHQELKNCNCTFWFYISFWLLVAAVMAQPSEREPATKSLYKTRGCNYSFELLMMGGVSPETCWAIKKHWNNKFYYTVASCWFFLWDLLYDARIHKHQVCSKQWLRDRLCSQYFDLVLSASFHQCSVLIFYTSTTEALWS